MSKYISNEDFLVYRIQNKDQEAFSFLYDNYAASIKGIILNIVLDETASEELVQDAFLRIWDKIDYYDKGKGRFFTWMLRIARNVSIDYLRTRESKKSEKTGSLKIENSEVIRQTSTEMEVDALGLPEVLKSLKKDDQEIIELLYLKGYSQSEASKKLKIPLGTVKTKVRTAIKQLRAKSHLI